MKYLVAIFLTLMCTGCAGSSRRTGEWISYDRVNVQLRRAIGMKPDDYVKACGHLINAGQFKTAKQLWPRAGEPREEEIVIADGASNFYDRRTGTLIVECGYWSCTRQPSVCDSMCPPPGWNCGWEMP